MKKSNNCIQECLDFIGKAIKNKTNVREICIRENRSPNYVANRIYEIQNGKAIKNMPVEGIKKMLNLYGEYQEMLRDAGFGKGKSNNVVYKYKLSDVDVNEESELTEKEKQEIEYDAYQDDNFDSRSKGECIRESKEEIIINDIKTQKISSYYYKILIKGKSPLEGFLTREEMEILLRLYSSIEGGAGLTIRAVSRYFKNLTFVDLKRILRAFNITKQSVPVPQHIIEEKTENEVIDIIFKNKEDNILKKLEEERGGYIEKILKDTQRELVEIKKSREDLVKNIKNTSFDNIVPFKVKKTKIKNKRALLVYLSDIHIGAHVPYDSIYKNDYNEEEARRRFGVVLSKVKEYYDIFGKFEHIIVCNLGDSIDGLDGQTVRRHHELSQNMDNKEQYNVFVNLLCAFFDSLYAEEFTNNIHYYAATDDNHSGFGGYVANKAVEIYLSLKYPETKVEIFEKFIQHFSCFGFTFILTHGKDGEHLKHGMPNTLNDRTEKYFEDYIRYNKIYTPNISICKGDLHQSATTFGSRIRYKSIPSFFGGSDYIHKNYGNNPPAFEFEVISEDSNEILSSRVELN